jgi:hypothetical protein
LLGEGEEEASGGLSGGVWNDAASGGAWNDEASGGAWKQRELHFGRNERRILEATSDGFRTQRRVADVFQFGFL